jgi:hypothetical protein
MTDRPRRFRVGYRNPATGEWVVGIPEFPDAIVGYYDPDRDQWTEGVANVLSGEWVPDEAMRGTGARDCPPGFPVKGNLPSMIFHTPGQPVYERTIPEVCFASEAAALAAGYRPARAGAVEERANIAPPAAPPPPPRPTAPPPPPPPSRNMNWLWWLLAALVILALIWWFFLRAKPQPAVEVTPVATVSAPAVTSPEATEAPLGVVSSPAGGAISTPAAVVASPIAAIASPIAAIASPVGAFGAATPAAATPVSAAAEAVATTAADIQADATLIAQTQTP